MHHDDGRPVPDRGSEPEDHASQGPAPGHPDGKAAPEPVGGPPLFVDGRVPGGYHPTPVTIAYEGHGHGEPLVLLHGAGHHRRAWDPVLPALRDAHETVALDLPGFGRSPTLGPSLSRDLDTTVAWMGSMFAALGTARPHVVGHSLGGLIALRLAQAGLARSGTAIAPAGFWTEAERRYAYAVLITAWQAARLLPQTVSGPAQVAPGRPSKSSAGVLDGRFGLWRNEPLIAGL